MQSDRCCGIGGGMRPKGTAVELERRRRRAMGLLESGHSLATVARMVGTAITREFGVHYHPAHVSRILAACGWSCQKPERRALERDEAAIAHWKRYRWTAIKKKPSA